MNLTVKGRLLQLFDLLEEADGVKRLRHGTQFFLLGGRQASREQEALQWRPGCVVDPVDLSSLNVFGDQLHRWLKAVHIQA